MILLCVLLSIHLNANSTKALEKELRNVVYKGDLNKTKQNSFLIKK